MSDKQPHPIDVLAGRNLRFHRMRAGISQVALADRLNITFQQVQKYERATNRISASRLWDCAQILNVPISAFFAEPSNPTDVAFDAHCEDILFSQWVRLYSSIFPGMEAYIIQLVKLLNDAFAAKGKTEDGITEDSPY